MWNNLNSLQKIYEMIQLFSKNLHQKRVELGIQFELSRALYLKLKKTYA